MMDDSKKNLSQSKGHEGDSKENPHFFKGSTYDSTLFEALVTNNHSIIFIVEPKAGEIINANNAACKFYGYSSDEFIGMKINNINVLSLEEIKKEILAAQTGERNYFNFKHKRKNGEIRHVEVYSSPIILNKTEYLYSIVHDVTDRIQTEALNKMLKHSLDIYTDGIYWMDSDNKFVYVNEAGGKAFGCKPEELIGKTLYDVNPTSTPEAMADLWVKLRNNETFISETVHRRLDGSEYYVEVRSVYFQYEGKEYNNGYARDITDRKKTELELQKAKKRAEESDHLKTSFIQNMSHEIRTPMNAIMGFSDLLVKNYNNKPKLEHFAGIINQRCNDLLDIINDILDISKIESGQLPVNIECCNLDSLFFELKIFFNEQQTRMNKKHISFDIINHYDSEGTISTDKVKLRQIFINLLTNAFKFTNKGKIEGGCLLNKTQQLVFYVSDTGIGIPPDKHEYIFERFSQLQKYESRSYGGTGLGLSIVKGLVDLLGGKVWLNSEPGKGTTFYFTIAYNKQPANEILPKPAEIIQEANHYPNKTILIVEDDPFNMTLIEEILSVTEVNILHAENGTSAIAIALAQTPDLILMDIGLPDMLGYEAIRQILLQRPTMKIVAQTAYATADDRNNAIHSGCIDYISKPLKAKNLLSLINKCLW